MFGGLDGVLGHDQIRNWDQGGSPTPLAVANERDDRCVDIINTYQLDNFFSNWLFLNMTY